MSTASRDPHSLPLLHQQEGCSLCIAHLSLPEDEATRLRALGVREGARVCLLRKGGMCVLALRGSNRLAVQRALLAHIWVRPA